MSSVLRMLHGRYTARSVNEFGAGRLTDAEGTVIGNPSIERVVVADSPLEIPPGVKHVICGLNNRVLPAPSVFRWPDEECAYTRSYIYKSARAGK